jgi:serine/threonine-protein kinase
LFTDIVGSTQLKSRIGSLAYWGLLQRHNELFEGICARFNCIELKHTGDGFFATFPTASDAVQCALLFQDAMRTEPWGHPLGVRIGIASGQVAVVEMAGRSDVIGLAADLASRVMSLAVGGQILMTRDVYDNAWHFGADRTVADDGNGSPRLKWVPHGRYFCKGCDDPIEVCEVGLEGLAPLLAPGQNGQAASAAAEEEEIPPWRPAAGLGVPTREGWTLERKLGEGGFGEVWLAYEPHFKHRVFKFCFDAQRLRSFKRELKLFERMRELDRNDIAKLVDVQLHQPPFLLASEYAAGGNLAEWVQEQGGLRHVPLVQRLAIVEKIADAVAAAHSVGVLHKDIKPANILIDKLPGGTVRPRISDFGIGVVFTAVELERRGLTQQSIARTFAGDESEGSGALMYSPPELLVDGEFTMQGDVYALGVLLYQMVVGELSRPLAPGWESDVPEPVLRELIGACVDGRLGRRLPSAASLARRLRGLEQERTRRRRVAWLRRCAVGCGAFAVLAVLLTVWGLRERNIRLRLAQLAVLEEQAIDVARAAAGADRPLDDVILRIAVDRLADGSFENRPLAGADLRQTVGNTYRSQRRFADAEPFLRQALEIRRTVPADDAQIARSYNDLGQLLHDQGKLADAEPLYREALAIRRRVLHPTHQHLAASLTTLGLVYAEQEKFGEAEPLLGEALAISRESDPTPQNLAASLNNHALALQGLRKLSAAEQAFREALQICQTAYPQGHRSVGLAMGNLALCLAKQGRHAEAAQQWREALDVFARAPGVNPQDRAWAQGYLNELEQRIASGAGNAPTTQPEAQHARHTEPPATRPAHR